MFLYHKITKMFCKVCFNINSYNFNNHNVKNPYGEIVCPTLLSFKCPLCSQYGHTPKYCNVQKSLEKKNYNIVSYDKPPVKTPVKTPVKRPVKTCNIISSKFSCLAIYDSEFEYDKCDNNICHIDIDHYGSYEYGVGFDNMIGVKWSDICI